MRTAATHSGDTSSKTPRLRQLDEIIVEGAVREARSREWREILVDTAGGDPMAAALASARLLAADAANTPAAIYVAIQSFYKLDSGQTATVMTRLAAEQMQPAAQAIGDDAASGQAKAPAAGTQKPPVKQAHKPLRATPTGA